MPSLEGPLCRCALAQTGVAIWRELEWNDVSSWHKTTYVRRGGIDHANERKFIRNKKLRLFGLSREVVSAGHFWL
jgi:hypothetical protein